MAMKGGRKNLKRAVNDETLTLQPGQSIMQVVSLRGSNLIEVIDAKGEKALAIFPAKFQKSMWIKRGSFVVVDDSGREEAVESGRKVACVVLQVLFHEQVRVLQKSPEWPEIFKSVVVDSSSGNSRITTQENEELDSSDDDGLPPLEANTNRRIPVELQSATDSEDSDVEDS
ncbi:putative translation initiation factor 1A (eIF-1A), RNA-binding domain, S1, IF1 type [Helianthus annuus]|uniref:Putative nucleic acid-binding, OB-fold-like protein n=1 Tax=Helianthus annuus TaxID=4232 RepID=A0A251SLU3_HELAN|nr:probable RNA-binding protein EIF1AD [Helianthus annuus]KAF5771202.1 putative translation initiation factor 1A (eIF-1A), RNA-binding domain, S1, IF1 type [Helianthus annuus]KAJ0471021.1 putative translation initiation factor 1A (eIF-1A), RNA-binding domain, S1, IF1 type [Helianthus annuus]KAJ0487625.1 putative translation initiation factor 1A (eIF-1A), RNA-binding domain, S1, IF1 type [Helianthus annuus]KAJ0661736.1 putative translation initiation factor 1A (eIF-1A), RNA-binding domain, S1, I